LAEIIKDATEIATEYYLDYSKYVLSTRALSNLNDGLKTVQKRLIWEALKLPNLFSKSVNLVGNTVKIHPHGSDATYSSLANLTCFTSRIPLFDSQGNFGGFNSPPAAARYTSCKLSDHARFNYQFLAYADFVEGEMGVDEPSALPCLIPYALVAGSEGIGVGFTSKVIPLDLMEVIDYYIDTIKDKSRKTVPRPDFGEVILLEDKKKIQKIVSKHEGSIEVVPVITQESDKILVVNCLYKKNIETVIKGLGDLINSDKVDFRNETSSRERYVFEINSKDISISELRDRLESICRVKANFKRLMTDGQGKAIYCSFDYVVRKSLEYLNEAIDRKFQSELDELQFKKSVLEALDYLKKSSMFKKLPNSSVSEVRGFIEKKFPSDVSSEVVKKPLSYVTKDHDNELEDILLRIKSLKDIDRVEYLVNLYEEYRELVLPYYNDRKHSIYESEISNKVKKVTLFDKLLKVTSSGIEVKSKVYLVTDSGYVFVRDLDLGGSTDISVSDISGTILGFATDFHKYLVVRSKNGIISFDLDNIDKDKKLVKLRDGEKITSVKGYYDASTIRIKKKTYRVNEFLRTKTSFLIGV